MQGNRLQVQAALKVDRGDDVPLVCKVSQRCTLNTVQVYTYCKVGVNPLPA